MENKTWKQRAQLQEGLQSRALMEAQRGWAVQRRVTCPGQGRLAKAPGGHGLSRGLQRQSRSGGEGCLPGKKEARRNDRDLGVARAKSRWHKRSLEAGDEGTPADRSSPNFL